MYETLEALRNPPTHLLEEDFLVKNVSFANTYSVRWVYFDFLNFYFWQILKINLTAEEMATEHRRQRSKRLAMQNSSK